MRPKRNDIRVSRKFVPTNSRSANKSRSTVIRQIKNSGERKTTDRSTKSISSILKRNEATGGPLVVPANEGADIAKQRPPKPLSEVSSARGKLKRKVVGEKREDDEGQKVNSEQRRRRSGAQSYINKRFLYDVVEPPKRTRQKKLLSFPERSTAALMAVSSANLMKRHKSKHSVTNQLSNESDFLFYLRSRRGRRLKPKLEYSPSPYINDVSPDEVISLDIEKRNHKKSKLQSRSFKSRSSNSVYSRWSRNKQLNRGHHGVLQDTDGSPLDESMALKVNYSEGTCLPNYSDVLLDGLDVNLRNAHADSSSDSRVQMNSPVSMDSSKFKNRFFGRSLVQNDIQKEAPDSYLRRSLFAPGSISPADESHSQDILDFCTGSHSEQFERVPHSGEMGVHEDDLESTESRNLTNRQVQQPQDELEEDLLAPELSILAGSASVANADGLLVSNLADTGAVVATTSVPGGSRRKSPVRPMQVLRTKMTSTAVPVNSQSTVIGATADGSSYIFTSPVVSNNVVYTRSLCDAEIDHRDDLLSAVLSNSHTTQMNDAQQYTDNSSKDNNQSSQASTIVRMTSLNNADITVRSHVLSAGSPNNNTSILSNVPVCVDGGNGTSATGLLPSLLSHNSTRPASQPVLSRVFVTNGTTRSVTTATTKSVVSTPHTSHASVSTRRRPTILKRTLGAANNSVLGTRETGFDLAETKVDLSVHSPASRTIGLFTANNNQVQKISTTTCVDDSGSMCATSSNAPTKLLQLVTTSSPTNQPPPNQTASDRLFGRRPATYNKSTSSILTNTLPPTPTTHPGGNEFRAVSTNATTNVTPPYRYAVVRGSADGRQYVLISSPRLVDQSIHDPIPLNNSTTHSLNEPHVQTSVTDENFNSDHMFPLDQCISGAFKVEINGAHMLHDQSGANIIQSNKDRQVRTIFTATPGTTTLAAT